MALKLLDEHNSIWLLTWVGHATTNFALNIKPRKIDKIFITHLHGDHLFGLQVVKYRSFQGGESELIIYGPKGIRQFVQTAMRISDSHLSYPIRFVELGDEGVIFEDNKFKVSFLRLDHRIESVGYRIVEKSHPGQLQVEKLKQLHIPSGPVYGQLKRGEKVTLEDGREIDGKEFLGKPQRGRIVAILGDTRKTKNSLVLARMLTY